MDLKIETEWQQRMIRFDRLFNKIVAKKLELDAANELVIKLEERAKINEERMKNPFYVTLKAQKEERDKFIDFYQNGLLFGNQTAILSNNDKGESDSVGFSQLQQHEMFDAIESDGSIPQANEAFGDLFAHTGVDIEEKPRSKNFQKSSHSDSKLNSPESCRKDVFCFYKL